MVWRPRVENLSLGQFLLGLAIPLVSVAILVFFSFQYGPNVIDEIVFSTYDCPSGRHFNFDNLTCKGIQQNKEEWSREMTIPTRISFTSFVTPFVNSSQDLDKIITIKWLIKGYGGIVIENGGTEATLHCLKDTQRCATIDIPKFSGDDDIFFASFRLSYNNTGIPELEDVVYNFFYYANDFLIFSIIIKLFLLIPSIAILIYYTYFLLKKVGKYQTLSQETKLIHGILIFLVIFNNPFFPLELAIHSFLFTLLSSWAELGLNVTFILFWLVESNRIVEKNMSLTQTIKITLGLIFFYIIFCAVFYSLTSLVPFSDITVSLEEGVFAGYIVICIIYWTIAIMVVKEGIIAFLVLKKKKFPQSKISHFFFFSLPAICIIWFNIWGTFLKTFAPFERDIVSFIFYTATYNAYVYLLVWGWWPIHEEYTSEDTPIIGHEDASL